ncbi:MAG: hypothetical protein COU09_01720 [Candidatus Harrisonbacteria bacterium CG10_big_fil_rev_8_21_14_0_10_44_23]|uniref:Uncharacterized protein n=1 Tax=Candidatus Harrisonbacteria bacterium CG10_big_fil_rev_8_21_14_0_10_44_23 TaxID=1974585 RepID=A0A2H0UQ28_9BACT|nr:MAG: hypothetical protein COU09_01720 [Candidatus Harrisonbacteria bacterium CG10_big_fil_rev_8_21_14_0_10_44_23]
MEDNYRYFAKLLNVDPLLVAKLDAQMQQHFGDKEVLQRLRGDNEEKVAKTLYNIKPENRDKVDLVVARLRAHVAEDEAELLDLLDSVSGYDKFEKAIKLVKKIHRPKLGYFLKLEKAREILMKRPPKKLLDFVGLSSVEELLEQMDIMEVFSALRFIESNEWMHETFDAVYSGLTPDDFEKRKVEIKVLDKRWKEVAQKFVEKKHHNVSHLKELGVIFLNPIEESSPGKFLRDFALLLHYIHEIRFYSRLFELYSTRPHFATHLKSLLRGDVAEAKISGPNSWLIIQRYLWKENPQDERLSLPRINPESLHWHRAERDLALYTDNGVPQFNMRIWNEADWAGMVLDNKVISFDLEDNVMSFVDFYEKGQVNLFNYHQREALWTKLFSEYVGGDDKLEELLIKSFEDGVVRV